MAIGDEPSDTILEIAGGSSLILSLVFDPYTELFLLNGLAPHSATAYHYLAKEEACEPPWIGEWAPVKFKAVSLRRSTMQESVIRAKIVNALSKCHERHFPSARLALNGLVHFESCGNTATSMICELR